MREKKRLAMQEKRAKKAQAEQTRALEKVETEAEAKKRAKAAQRAEAARKKRMQATEKAKAVLEKQEFAFLQKWYIGGPVQYLGHNMPKMHRNARGVLTAAKCDFFFEWNVGQPYFFGFEK